MTLITPRRISLWLKVPYTAFMAVPIPVYANHYGPSIFLYFCDVALLLTLIAVWTFLAQEHSAKRTAERFDITPARVTQLRQRWRREWQIGQGEDAC